MASASSYNGSTAGDTGGRNNNGNYGGAYSIGLGFILPRILSFLSVEESVRNAFTNELINGMNQILTNFNNKAELSSGVNRGGLLLAFSAIIVTAVIQKYSDDKDIIEKFISAYGMYAIGGTAGLFVLYKLYNKFVEWWNTPSDKSNDSDSQDHTPKSDAVAPITPVVQNVKYKTRAGFKILEIQDDDYMSKILAYFGENRIIELSQYIIKTNSKYTIPNDLEIAFEDTYKEKNNKDVTITGIFYMSGEHMYIGCKENQDVVAYIEHIIEQINNKNRNTGIIVMKTYRAKPIGQDGFNTYTMSETQDTDFQSRKDIYMNSFFHPDRDYLWNFLRRLNDSPEKLYKFGQVPKFGMLIHGPPGTGKSSFAYRVANALKREIVTINLSKYKSYHELFSALVDPSQIIKDKKPKDLIYMFDEFDQYIEQLSQRIDNYNNVQSGNIQVKISELHKTIREKITTTVEALRDSGELHAIFKFDAVIKCVKMTPSPTEGQPPVSTPTTVTHNATYRVNFNDNTMMEFINSLASIGSIAHSNNVVIKMKSIDEGELQRHVRETYPTDCMGDHVQIEIKNKQHSVEVSKAEIIVAADIQIEIDEINRLQKYIDENKTKNFISFEELQEIFDGPIPIIGAIFIGTTNKIQYLMDKCPTLIRPGRLTPYYFGNMNNVAFRQLVNYYFDMEPEYEIDDAAIVLQPSMAVLLAMQIKFKYEDTDVPNNEQYAEYINMIEKHIREEHKLNKMRTAPIPGQF